MPVGQGPWARLLFSHAYLRGPASCNQGCRTIWYQIANWVGVAGIPERGMGLTDRLHGCSYIYYTNHWRTCLLPYAIPRLIPSLWNVIHSAKSKLPHVANFSRDTGLHRLGLQGAMWPWPDHFSICRWQGSSRSQHALHLQESCILLSSQPEREEYTSWEDLEGARIAMTLCWLKSSMILV